MEKVKQPGLSGIFFKMACGTVSVAADVGVSGFSAFLATQIPDPLWQGAAAAFSVISMGCAYDDFKVLKQHYQKYDEMVCREIDQLFTDNLPLKTGLSVD